MESLGDDYQQSSVQQNGSCGLRKRKQQQQQQQKQQISQQELDLEKKKLLLDEGDDFKKLEDSNNNNTINTINQSGTTNEDQFSDLKTIGNNKRSSNSNSKSEPEMVSVFGSTTSGSIGQTAKDQFAAALLRLQADLDTTSSRLDKLEAKLGSATQNSINNKQKNVQFSSSSTAPSSSRNGNNKNSNMINSLVFIGWPVLVYVALRVVERRYISSNKA